MYLPRTVSREPTNNFWIIKQGTSACAEMSESCGAHYRDYTNFSNCNVSWLKPSEGKLKNINRITIGHRGICPTCGTEHGSSDSIICSDCFNEIKRCPHCGRRVGEDDHIEIDGQVYCSTCARYCIHHQRYEIDTMMVCSILFVLLLILSKDIISRKNCTVLILVLEFVLIHCAILLRQGICKRGSLHSIL